MILENHIMKTFTITAFCLIFITTSILSQPHLAPKIIYYESDSIKCYEIYGTYFQDKYCMEDDKSRISQGALYTYDDVLEDLYIIEYINSDQVKISKIQYYAIGKLAIEMYSCNAQLISNKKIFNKMANQIKTEFEAKKNQK